MKILVLGYMVRGPLGGLAWHHFQYILGLNSLGHDILFLEDSDDFPSCYHPPTCTMSVNPAYGLKFIRALFNKFSLSDKWSYYDAHTNSWYGLSRRDVVKFCQSADIVLNISGVNPARDWWISIPHRVFIDTDPVFVQLRHLKEPKARELAKVHTSFFSFGENIGNEDCSIPLDGFNWKPTRQPVFVPAWKMHFSGIKASWTTVMQWDSYKTGEYNGQLYGMKSHSFDAFFSLPQLLNDENFELALGSATAPKEKLMEMGWNVIDPFIATETPYTFQEYIASSKGEWTVAKHGYVVSNSGWFSERTLSYMASGKPVIVQDTGFREFLPTGNGLFAFSTLEEAIEQVIRINADYAFHCKQARIVVDDYFDSLKVLTSLLDRID